MNPSLHEIPYPRLLLLLILFVPVIFIYIRWSLNVGTLLYAIVRMVIQLLLVGLALAFLFGLQSPFLMILLMTLMLLISTWIALRPLPEMRRLLFSKAFGALAIGGIVTLAIVIFGVVRLKPWYDARYFIPLAGMIFSNGMNSISLAAERLQAELKKGTPWPEARHTSFQTAFLPLLNNFFALGIVSIPGVMTGQILSGVSPFLAVRYQIMVMSMLMGASGISTALYLWWMGKGETASLSP